jgi:hypothetical protein
MEYGMEVSPDKKRGGAGNGKAKRKGENKQKQGEKPPAESRPNNQDK